VDRLKKKPKKCGNFKNNAVTTLLQLYFRRSVKTNHNILELWYGKDGTQQTPQCLQQNLTVTTNP
jgi:hypothetical protein